MLAIPTVTLLVAAATLAIGAAGSAPLAAAQAGLPCVAISDFENASGLGEAEVGATAAVRLAELLAGTGELRIISPNQMRMVIAGDGASIWTTTSVTPEETLEAAASEGCAYVVVGTITEFTASRKSGGFGRFRVDSSEAKVTINARLLETASGNMVEALEGSGSKRFIGIAVPDFDVASGGDSGYAVEAMGPAVEKLVEQIVDLAPGLEASMATAASNGDAPALEGEVVGTPSGDRVYIDLGQNRGIQDGMRFSVLHVVDTIRDAEGNVLDRILEPAGVLEVIQTLSQSAICKIVDGTPRVGDLVQLER